MSNMQLEMWQYNNSEKGMLVFKCMNLHDIFLMHLWPTFNVNSETEARSWSFLC